MKNVLKLLACVLLLASCAPTASEQAQPEEAQLFALAPGDKAFCGSDVVEPEGAFTTFALCVTNGADKARFTFPSEGADFNCESTIQKVTNGIETTTCVFDSPKNLYKLFANGVSILDAEYDTRGSTKYLQWPAEDSE